MLPNEASPCTIFYSWQAQLPATTNRSFIEDALGRAAKAVRDDITIEARPEIDDATANTPGSPDIPDTIRAKIDAAQIVVCDVSIVQGPRWFDRWLGGNVRPTPNANVLIEVGYAMSSLRTTKRLILVMNKAYGKVEELPFDLRQHRPTIYHLAKGSADKAQVRKQLASAFEATFKLVFKGPRRRDVHGESLAQASQVSAWSEVISHGPMNNISYRIRVKNSSKQPIYDCTATLLIDNTEPRAPVQFSVVAAEHEETSIMQTSWTANAVSGVEGNMDLVFRDSWGLRWHRHTDGRLTLDEE